jgi:hypothetical protein
MLSSEHPRPGQRWSFAFSGLLLLLFSAAPAYHGWTQPELSNPNSDGNTPVVTVENVGPDSFQTAWKEINGAARYEVSWGTDPEAANRGTLFASEAAFARSNLIAATSYYIKVRAITNGRAGAWSAVALLATSMPSLTGLAVEDVSDTTIHLAWPGLYAEIPDMVYEVSLGTDLEAASLGIQSSRQNILVLSQLHPGTTYYLKIRLRRGLLFGPWSAPVPVATLAATSGSVILPDAEGAPLKLVEVAHTTARFNWSETNSAAGYELSYLPLPATDEKKALSLRATHPPADLPDLIPGQAYRVKWRAIFPNRVGTWSPDLSFSTFPVPPSPETLYLAKVTDSYVLLTWTAVESVTAYEAVASLDEPGEEGSRQVIHRGEARLGSLRENTRYWAKVRTLNQGGPGNWSAPLAFTTLLDSAPEDLRILRQSAAESAATWNVVPGNAPTTYELRLAPGGEGWRIFPGQSSQTRSLENLSPDTRYRVQVRAKNAVSVGPWSREVSFHTPPLPPQDAPKELRVTAVTDVSGKITWKPLPGVATYRLGLGSDTYASNRGEETVSAADYELKGLVPETNYFARVKAVNSIGEGPWSEIVGFSTMPSPPGSAPEGVDVMDVTTKGLTMVWTPSPDAINYEVGYGPDLQAKNTQIQSTATFSCTLSSLKPGATYYLRVRKINRGGNGPWSQSRTATIPAP